jgi:hypothetical protein
MRVGHETAADGGDDVSGAGDAISGEDPYTGQIEEGGGPAERHDGRLLVRKLSVGDMDNNVYVIADAETGAALIVDAADEADRIRAAKGAGSPNASMTACGR